MKYFTSSALLFSIALTGCGGEDTNPGEAPTFTPNIPAPPTSTCEQLEETFTSKVFPILRQDCSQCHFDGGDATNTAFILDIPQGANFNYAATLALFNAPVNEQGEDGYTLFVNKPTGKTPHFGGLRIANGSVQEQDMIDFRDQARRSSQCRASVSIPTLEPTRTPIPTQEPTPIPSTPPPQPTRTLIGDPVIGEATFKEQICTGCHTDNNDGTFTNLLSPGTVFDIRTPAYPDLDIYAGANYTGASVEDLSRYLEERMPFGGPESCVDDCANNIAEYLWAFRPDALQVAGPVPTPSIVVGAVSNLSFRDQNLRNCVEAMGVDFVRDFTSLECSRTISDFSAIEALTELTSLKLTGGRYRDEIDISGLTGLTELVITNASLSSIDLSALTELETLDLSNNDLSKLDVSALSDLETLDVSGTDLVKLDISENKRLSDVTINDSNIGCNTLTEWSYSNGSTNVSHTINNCQTNLPSGQNHYTAAYADRAPTIDGFDNGREWDDAQWDGIDVAWPDSTLGAVVPSPDDYQGRYKVMWDAEYVYMLFDITDEAIVDINRDPLTEYWNDDTIEIFIDEDRSGGDHDVTMSAQAWAYHVSTHGDVVDRVNQVPVVLSGHVESSFQSQGNRHTWEMRMRIYGPDYNFNGSNTPLKLYEGKIMGFTASYIDNDAQNVNGGSIFREHFIGSVDTEGHRLNQGFTNSDGFGSILLGR